MLAKRNISCLVKLHNIYYLFLGQQSLPTSLLTRVGKGKSGCTELPEVQLSCQDTWELGEGLWGLWSIGTGSYSLGYKFIESRLASV